MIWKNQFLHLTNGDVSAVYGDSALFFKYTSLFEFLKFYRKRTYLPIKILLYFDKEIFLCLRKLLENKYELYIL